MAREIRFNWAVGSFLKSTRWLLCFAGLAAGFWQSPATCQDTGGSVVTSIDVRYVGAKLISPQRILSQISTTVGKPLSSLQVNEDIDQLLKSGEVRNARILGEESGKNGVKVIVVVECQPLYGGVQFTGNESVPTKKLSRLVKLKPNQPIAESSLVKTRQEIATLYRKKGYPEARIAYQYSKPNSKGFAKVVFQIDERKPGVLRTVHFKGNSALSATQLKSVMKQQERGVKSLLTGGGRTDALSITADVKAIEDLYRKNGHFDARVVSVAKIPVDGKFNDLLITIQEGQAYEVTEITINGVNVLSRDQDIAPLLKSRAGKTFSGTDLDADIKAITELYRSKGYIDARVVPRLEEPASP